MGLLAVCSDCSPYLCVCHCHQALLESPALTALQSPLSGAVALLASLPCAMHAAHATAAPTSSAPPRAACTTRISSSSSSLLLLHPPQAIRLRLQMQGGVESSSGKAPQRGQLLRGHELELLLIASASLFTKLTMQAYILQMVLDPPGC